MKNIRLKGYDYSTDGYYFITICSQYQLKFTENEKQIIGSEIHNLKNIVGVGIDYNVVMDTHIHLIIVLNNCALGLGEIVRRLKAKSSRLANRKLWQPNYYEHVIRNERALYKIREYVQNNPLNKKIQFGEFYK